MAVLKVTKKWAWREEEEESEREKRKERERESCCHPPAHSGCVRGVVSDAVNMEVFSGAADKTIKVMDDL